MNQDQCPLTEVIELVVAAMEQYQASLAEGENPLPPITSAKFEFQSTASKTEGFEIDLFIFKFGSSHENDVMNDIIFTYLPTTMKVIGPVLSPSNIAASRGLSKLIESAARGVESNPGFLGLGFHDLTATLQYGVTWSIDGAGSWTYSFVTASLSGGGKKNTLQKIMLTFGKSEGANG